mmetsp:Transcript_42756/g.99658  ORF Transcript_42756/g.99658 Transcript_42756/m.99658 type:complete len:425 (+) Transcript_42756:36-1310(+)
MAPRPSPGCVGSQSRSAVQGGKLVEDQVEWEEPGLPPVNRTVLTYLPVSASSASSKPSKPLPLVLVFHGLGGNAISYHDWFFRPLAEAAGFLAVYPQGLSDTADGEPVPASWNAVGSSNSSDSAPSCDVSRATSGVCYESCKLRKGRCHPCDWTTCYDDVAFVQKLLLNLRERYCLDLDRLYAYGCSNGGLFVHQLAQSLPEDFVAVAASCGGKPHRGYERNFKRHGEPVSMMLLQGTHDHSGPAFTPAEDEGWWDGYYYANETAVTSAYADYDKCSKTQARKFILPPKVNSQGLACTEYGYACSGNASVVECRFDGGHEILHETGWNDLADGPEVAWYFLCQHSRGGKVDKANCILPQREHMHPFSWGLLTAVLVGIAFVFFGFLVWSRRRKLRTPLASESGSDVVGHASDQEPALWDCWKRR